MDIRSDGKYPERSLSNFAPHPFEIDGVKCNSMEGFLQSLKIREASVQVEVCLLVGITAKRRGKKFPWWETQILYWRGESYKRDSRQYQELLDRAYEALVLNATFRKALLASQNAHLTHSIGQKDIHRTILTEREFCSRLMRLRTRLQKEERAKAQATQVSTQPQLIRGKKSKRRQGCLS